MRIEIICNERGTGKTACALEKYRPNRYFSNNKVDDYTKWNNTQNFYYIIDSIDYIPEDIFNDLINKVFSVEWEAVILIFDIKKEDLADCKNFNVLSYIGKIPRNYVFTNFVATKEVFYTYFKEYYPTLNRNIYDQVIKVTNYNFNRINRLMLLNRLYNDDQKEIVPQALSKYINELTHEIYKDIPNADTFLQKASIIGEQFTCDALESSDGFGYDAASAYLKQMNTIHGIIQKCIPSNSDYAFISHDVYECIFENITYENKMDWIKILIQYYKIQYEQCDDNVIHIAILNRLNSLYKLLPTYTMERKRICFLLLYEYRRVNKTQYALKVAQEITDDFTGKLTTIEYAFVQNYQIVTLFQLWEYRRALEILNNINSCPQYIGSKMLIKYYYAYCSYQIGNVDKSYTITQQLVDYLKSTSGTNKPSHKLFCMTYSLMATLQNHLDKEDSGLRYYRLALNNASKNKKDKYYYDILKKCDMFYEYEDIKINLKKCLQFYEQKGDNNSAGEVYVNLATEMMFQDCKEKNKIKQYFEKAICYFAENNSKKLVYAKNNYAIYLIMVEKDIKKGLKYFEESLLAGLSDFTYMSLYLNISMCYILLGDIQSEDFTNSCTCFKLAKRKLNQRENATKYEDIYAAILNIILAENGKENVETLCVSILNNLDNNSFFTPLFKDIVKRNCNGSNSVYKENAFFYKTMNEMRCFFAEFRFWE